MARPAQGQREATHILVHPAVDDRIIKLPEQVGLELVDPGKRPHVDDAAEILGQRGELHLGSVDDGIEQTDHRRTVFELRDGAEEFRHPEIPSGAAVGHGQIDSRYLHGLHEAEHVAMVEHMVDEVLFLQRMAGETDAVLITPVGNALRKILGQQGAHSLVEVPPDEFGRRVGAPVERG